MATPASLAEIASVLIFPPVSSFHRFLIHQTCENICKEHDLCTFSVGQGYYRRTVVCYRNQVLDPSKISAAQTATASSETQFQKPIENWRSPNVSSSTTHTKPLYDRWHSGFKMGAGINGNDNREHKLQSMERTQPANSSRNYSLCYEIVETTPSTSQHSIHRQNSADGSASITNSVSCGLTPSLSNENGGVQKSVITSKDKSNATNVLSASSQVGDQPSKVQIARRERRPDRAVYIPRARRSQTTPPTTAATTATSALTSATATPTPTETIMTTTIQTNSAIVGAICTLNTNTNANTNMIDSGSSTAIQHQKSNSIINFSGAVSTTSSSKADDITKKRSKIGNCNNQNFTTGHSIISKERRSEKQRKSLEKSKSNSQKEVTNKESSSLSKIISSKQQKDCDRKQDNQSKDESSLSEQAHATAHASKFDLNQEETQSIPPTEILELRATEAEIDVSSNIMKSTKNSNLTRLPPLSTVHNGLDDVAREPKMKNELPVPNKVSHILIEELTSSRQGGLHGGKTPKCDIDEQELQRASKEINRSNRRIIKQTFVSDVLEIPEKIEHTSYVNAYISNAKTLSSPSSATNFDSNTEDEEDDWESKYNESGDCLDPRILEELESAVGKVQITTPKTDYSAFQTNQSILNDEEFPHVLEVSNFPVEFKNQDLLMVFSQYKESGFDIKWVDDTHALAVFSSSRVAAEVLTMGHPFVVLKPLAEATLESRLKAKKCAGSLQPYRQRPETCAALARRLVTGALGVRLETAAAERENEKRVLRKAKERKLLAAKQRDEAWES